MRILAIGDVHLGRVPTGLPDGLDAAGLGPREALRRAVDEALGGRADAVLLAGDVVDEARDVFEAYAALRREVGRLAEAGIPVLGVAGNHDVHVLPRLAEELGEGFRLVGAQGRWEVATLGDVATVVGWSFPREHVADSPLAEFPAAIDRKGPVLGLLHCDVDGGDSRYAPVRRRELREAPVDAWLLGHVHKPDLLDDAGGRPVGYLGAVTALDPSDLGARGPWWIETDDRGALRARHVPLAPLRFEDLEIEVAGRDLGGAEDLPALVRPEAESRLLAAADAGAGDVTLGLRVRLVGVHPRPREIAEAAEALAGRDGGEAIAAAGGAWFVERWDVAVHPWRDLAEIEALGGPAGWLARVHRIVEGEWTSDLERLLARVRRDLGSALQGVPDEEVRRIAAEAARELLIRLLTEREGGR